MTRSIDECVWGVVFVFKKGRGRGKKRRRGRLKEMEGWRKSIFYLVVLEIQEQTSI